MDNNRPEMIEFCTGKAWTSGTGRIHREDGPAVEYADGRMDWFLHGCRHRSDGPAVEYANGTKEWYLHNNVLTFNEWLDQNNELTGEEKVMFKLEHG